MNKSISRIIVLANRNLKEILRDPLSLMFTFAMPLLLEVLFYLIFHQLTPQFEMKYLAPGIVVFAQSFVSLFTGSLIATDRNSSFLTRLYVSKAKPYEFIISYGLAVVPIIIAQSLLFFLIGGIIDSSIFCLGMLWGVLLSLLTSFLFISFGILFGSLCNEKSIGGVASIVIVGQSVLSGMWFQTEGLDAGMMTFMKCLPFKNATDLLTNSLNGIANSFSEFWLPLIIVLAYTIVSFVISVMVFKCKMKNV